MNSVTFTSVYILVLFDTKHFVEFGLVLFGFYIFVHIKTQDGSRLTAFLLHDGVPSISQVSQTEPVAEFDERLWGAMVDYVTVGVDGGMTVVFRDGAALGM